ncbi:MAG: hypothetical protein JW953_00030 [Anaerolineae bacterium]|nr:hypothetical protein [Anaerolineae bacterium]
MKQDLTHILDSAAQQLAAGEPILSILAKHTAEAQELYPLLQAAAMLETLRPVEMPAPPALQADREEFLAKVINLQQQPVSTGPLSRLKAWIVHYLPWNSPNSTYQRKEQWQMSTLLIKAALISSIVFGSVGATAAYASNSLPGSPVYPLKLTMEQTRLALTTDPITQANLYLNLAQERLQEMEQMAQQGDIPAESTLNHLQQHLNQALHLAAQQSDTDMQDLLAQTQQMLQDQQQTLAQTQTQTQANQAAQQTLGQANQMLSHTQEQVQQGLAEPQAFRHRYGPNRPDTAPAQPTTEPQPTDPPAGDCPAGNCEPASDEHKYGQNPDHEPGPHGDCETGDCEPVGDEYKYGQDHDQIPAGPHGDCETGDCKPVGDEHKYGQDPDHEPGPHGDCETGDCEPAGDQNQQGQPDQQPAGPHGDPGCTGDCEPAGDQNQNQHQNQHQNNQPPDLAPTPDPDPQPEPANPEPQPQPNPNPPAQPPDSGNGDGNNNGGNSSGGSGGSGGRGK